MAYTKPDTSVVDTRLAAIPMVRDPMTRNVHYRAFNTGISSMSVFTADDMISLLQQLPFVVGTGTGTPLSPHFTPILFRLCTFISAVIPDEDSAHAFIAASSATRKMLVLLKKRDGGSDANLDDLDHQAQRLGPLLVASQDALDENKRENVNIPKVHSCLHYR